MKKPARKSRARQLDPALLADLVAANHILADQGVLDAWGHVSVRDPENPERFWLSRSVAPSLVTAEDILEHDIDSEPVSPDGRKLYIERYIHGEAYRARPDVMAVCHHHSPTLVSFSVSRTLLRPLTGPAGFLGTGVPVFDIRDVDKGPVLIIVNAEQGRAAARALGQHAVLLLARHGAIAVGNSLRQVVWRGVYSELNARQQIDAMRLGPDVDYLSPEEAAYAAERVPPDNERAWNLWKLDAAKRRA